MSIVKPIDEKKARGKLRKFLIIYKENVKLRLFQAFEKLSQIILIPSRELGIFKTNYEKRCFRRSYKRNDLYSSIHD